MTSPLTPREIERGRDNNRIGTVLVLNEQGMCVWHLRLEPGQSIPAHRHDRPYFWTVLTDGKARSRYCDGRIVDVVYNAGQTQNFPDLGHGNAFVHDLTNTGSTPLLFVTVEFSSRTGSTTTGH